MSAPVAILAGGTGGHIFPGLAVAQVLRERQVPVLWIGARGRMEATLVPAQGFAFEEIDIAGIRGRGLGAMLSGPLRVLRAVWQARALLKQARPRAVISFGGYAAGPAGLAAWLARIPLLVHEQNSRPGITNRVLSRLARRVLQAFPDSFPSGLKAQTVGNPVRAQIAELAPPAVRMADRSGAVRVLVLGGSQGARALNRDVPLALAALVAQGVELDVLHQCGERGVELATQAYTEAGVASRIEPFIADMAQAYAWADLVVCRAGALTLSEICAAGIASVLVPLPSAADDHQTWNAEYLVEHGAAVRVAEGDDFAPRLAEQIHALAGDAALRLERANAARSLARVRAAEEVVDAILAEARQ